MNERRAFVKRGVNNLRQMYGPIYRTKASSPEEAAGEHGSLGDTAGGSSGEGHLTEMADLLRSKRVLRAPLSQSFLDYFFPPPLPPPLPPPRSPPLPPLFPLSPASLRP